MRIENLGKRGSEVGNTDNSKDKCVGNGENRFMNWTMEKRWEMLNGCAESDWEGECT